MQTYSSDQIATELTRWLRKPLLHWWFLANLAIASIAIVVAILTHAWWLFFVPALAFVECAALHFGSILAEVLRDRDAEVQRLRNELRAV